MEPLSKIPGGMRYDFGREARLRQLKAEAVGKLISDLGRVVGGGGAQV
jgi:hypothetical protein